MSENKEFNEAQLSPQELAKHLRQPDGETGKKVGEMMNKGNQHICLNTYKVLAPNENDHVLEIGMGNGSFIKDLLSITKGLKYKGVDFSPTMIGEASTINQNFIENGTVSFVEASIESLPFENNTFNSICTTNTLYFWPNPTENIKELLRVLKPDGQLVIGYRNKELMDQLELANYGFTKYTVAQTEKLLSDAGFNEIKTEEIPEPELDFDGKKFQISGFYSSAKK